MVIKFEFHYPEEYRTSSFYDYYGFFRKLDYGYLYCFLSDIKRDTVIADFFDFTGQRINHIELQVKDCLPPSMWIYDENSNYVIVGYKSAIDLISMSAKHSNLSFDEMINNKLYGLSKEEYVIGDYLIRHPSATKYECYSLCTGLLIWKHQLKGYLYHSIVLNKGTFIICTAEHGGGIYLIDAVSGVIKSVVLTKGTREFCIADDTLYTYVLGAKGALLSVSLDSGKIVDKKELYRVTLDCPLLVQNGEALTLSFLCVNNREIREYVPIISAIEI